MIYYGAQRVCILPGCLNFNFLILFSCAVPPEFYGILLHSTYVYIYDFTKEYKKWKQLKNSSRNDQSVILMQVLCSQLHTPLRVLIFFYRPSILNLNTAAYSLWVPGAVCLCLGGKKEFYLFCHTLSQSDLFSAQSRLATSFWTCKTTTTIRIEVCTTM